MSYPTSVRTPKNGSARKCWSCKRIVFWFLPTQEDGITRIQKHPRCTFISHGDRKLSGHYFCDECAKEALAEGD